MGKPSPSRYRKALNWVYSNSKYLADFQYDMSLEACEHACNNWKSVCLETCTQDLRKHSCLLGDDVKARHFTVEESCQRNCIGFNMHPHKGHCTLFSDNLVLLDGGRGTFYHRRGASDPIYS